MITDKYTKHTVFILPLVLPEIKGNELLQNGFVNAYEYDLNNYILTEHILLAFRIKKYDLKQLVFIDQLKSNVNYSSTYDITIDKTEYTILRFNIPKSSYLQFCIKNIKSGLYEDLSYDTKINILQFWNVKSISKIHKYLFDTALTHSKVIAEAIPKIR